MTIEELVALAAAARIPNGEATHKWMLQLVNPFPSSPAIKSLIGQGLAARDLRGDLEPTDRGRALLERMLALTEPTP